jgi:hypothetical protein
MFYKCIACIHSGHPLIWSTEFDSKAAADKAAEFLRTHGNFDTIVIADVDPDESENHETAPQENVPSVLSVGPLLEPV